VSTRPNIEALDDIYGATMLLLAEAKSREKPKHGGMLSSSLEGQWQHNTTAFLKRVGLV